MVNDHILELNDLLSIEARGQTDRVTALPCQPVLDSATDAGSGNLTCLTVLADDMKITMYYCSC